MNRADITEMHYITAIAILPSIMRHGISVVEAYWNSVWSTLAKP